MEENAIKISLWKQPCEELLQEGKKVNRDEGKW